jgi:hypothetical protein
MPFLVLTRAGFDGLVSRIDPAGAVFHLKVDPRVLDALEHAPRSANAVWDVFTVERPG